MALENVMNDHRRVLEPTNGEFAIVALAVALMLAVALFGGPGVPW